MFHPSLLSFYVLYPNRVTGGATVILWMTSTRTKSGFKEGISGGSEEKKNRWRAEKLEAARETWALLGSFACAQDDPLSTWQIIYYGTRSSFLRFSKLSTGWTTTLFSE